VIENVLNIRTILFAENSTGNIYIRYWNCCHCLDWWHHTQCQWNLRNGNSLCRDRL